LGLVLYEIFTGRRVFEAANLADLIRQHESSTPKSPSQLVEGVDPLVERVILRCLENEPANRPRSALQVAAALPGGDPLAAALAAGETPSPEMVAAAGGEGVMEPKLAWGALLATLVVLAAIVLLSPYSTDLGLASPRKTLGALQERSEQIIERIGYTDPPADRASWFERNYEFMLYQVRQFSTPVARKNIAHAEQGVLTYFYRQSPLPLAAWTSFTSRIGPLDPPHEISGMITVVLDGNGRFIGFWCVPPQVEKAPGKVSEPNWSQMLADTGLDPASLTSVEPTWLPPVGFDRRFGWRGFYPEDPKTEIQISAASYRGKPVYFQVIGPWTRPWRMQAQPRTLARMVSDSVFLLGGVVITVVAALFARRNLRLGRGDRKGAFRISAFVFCVSVCSGFLVAHHVVDLGAEFQILVRTVGEALFSVVSLWFLYVALEPYVRRQWPELLISWSRLLSGRFRDPLIGRDLLVGILFGSITALLIHAANALPCWVNLPGETAVPINSLTLGSPLDVLGVLLGTVPTGVFPAFAITFILFLAKTLLRRYWPSVLATGLLILLINLGGENFALELPLGLLVTVISMFVLLRFGMFALAVEFLTGAGLGSLLLAFPVTLDLTKWYATHSLFMFAILLALLVYGLRIATGNKPLLEE
jgi:hypothetical protein